MIAYRATIVAAVQALIGLLTAFGVILPEGAEAFLVDNAVAIAGAVIAIGAVHKWIKALLAARKTTTQPEKDA